MNVMDEATDLAVSITGNASSVGIGDTVHLVISLSNLGPKSCDAKLNYKIPVGLKLLSSQGHGAYDVASGVWDAGLLLVNDTISLDLVLQATNIGYFVNIVSVYGDLTSTHAVPAKPIVKVFNGKWKSTAAMSDSNSGNNKASFSFDVRSPTYQTPSHEYKWPYLPDPTPTPTPQPDKEPQPTPKPKDPPKPTPVKDAKIADWTLNPFNDDTDMNASHVDVPDWAWAVILVGTFIGCALVITPADEYLMGVINGIITSVYASLLYLTYLTGNFLRSIVNSMMGYFVRSSGYITDIIGQSKFTPINGVGWDTLAGIGLKHLERTFPWLQPVTTPALYALEQGEYYNLTQNIEKFSTGLGENLQKFWNWIKNF
ncbi:MAG: hypothetical protein CVV28_12355 [Methanobacteriales archaeon HGW-Methanobacteriales-1]|nr:MAG: hypothetical protein CVV28_12355 [Methanobacteriales archaeon HGW-Methanobacteriales-1]